MQVKWVSIALDDFREAIEYIAQDNPEAAREIARRIWAATQNLKNNPEIGRPGRVLNTRELVVSDTPFIIPYRVENKIIQILRVLHGARKWPQKF
jgi:addiction module RelE/StbE family toxin